MLGVSVPLVQAAKKRGRSSLDLIGLFAIGAVMSASALGLLLAIAGSQIRPQLGDMATGIVLSSTALLLAAADLGIGSLRTPSVRRQTSPLWLRRYGTRRTFFLWGLDLGLGFTTIRVSSLYWLLCLSLFLVVPIALAPAVASLYGIALVSSLSASLTRSRVAHDPRAPAIRALRRAPLLSHVSGAMLAITGVLLLSTLLAGG